MMGQLSLAIESIKTKNEIKRSLFVDFSWRRHKKTHFFGFTHLLQANNVSPKVLRWRAMVGEFDFDVKYIPGGENVIADSLSRVFSIADVDADSGIQLSQETFLEFQAEFP